MKTKVIIKFITTILLMFFTFSIPFSATAEESLSENRYYMGEAVKTGLDNGYKGEEKIKEGDVHFNWKLGEFFVDGFTSVVKDEDDSPIFLKNVGDTVTLWFNLKQNIEKLNDNDDLSISEDKNGSDEYFSVPKTDFGRGALIIRKTGYTNAKEDPVIYKDYLAAKVSPGADTEVELCEEGDYEVVLNYEIKNDPRKVFDVSIVPTYSNYRIFFTFSVRNGNSMVYPRDVKTNSELTNTSVTENGFYLDFANSRYLDINIKKEILNKGANGLAEDVRFNRPAKDGDEYTEEGIYTITSSNKYTGQLTTKKIYVGKDDVLKAVTTNGLSVTEVQDFIAAGAKIDDDGKIILAGHETLTSETANTSDLSSTRNSTPDSAGAGKYTWIIILGAGLLAVVIITIIVIFRKTKNTTNKANRESIIEDKEE